MEILIISQHIFPIQTPRAHRTTELAKELSRQGHDLTIYAVLGNFNYSAFLKKFKIDLRPIKLKYQIRSFNSDGFKKRNIVDRVLGKLLGKLFEFPEIEFMFRVKEIFKTKNNYDLLISIADPHHIHWGCSKAKKKYPLNFPKIWIADCGDPFMENGKTKNHLNYFKKYERIFCELCDFITVPIENAKKAYYQEYRQKIKVIPQGFELKKNTSMIFENKKEKVIKFLYAGTFLPDLRNPKNLFEYLTSINKPFKFYVFTEFDKLIKPYMNKLGEKLVVKKYIPREELLNFMQNMDFLINIQNKNNTTQLPSKLIDYAISGKPVINLNPEKLDIQNLNQFLNKDYRKKFVIENIEQYDIKNVVSKFMKLANA